MTDIIIQAVKPVTICYSTPTGEQLKHRFEGGSTTKIAADLYGVFMAKPAFEACVQRGWLRVIPATTANAVADGEVEAPTIERTPAQAYAEAVGAGATSDEATEVATKAAAGETPVFPTPKRTTKKRSAKKKTTTRTTSAAQ